MTAGIVVVAAVVVVFAVLAPRIGRRLPPRAAIRVLVPACLVLAGCTVLVLAITALTWLGQLPVVSTVGDWSPQRLDTADPVPEVAAAACVALLVFLGVRAVLLVVRRTRALVPVLRANKAARAGTEVVIVDSERLEAFATPAPHGRIVITTALLAALSPAERRVVLAHERSHVAGLHAWWTLLADLAAAVNPALIPTATAVGQAVERWADEDAARCVGDRTLVAKAIARAALLRHNAPAAAAGRAATGGDVPRRVRALLEPAPRWRPYGVTVLAALLLAGTIATAVVERTGDHLFDQAGSHHHSRHHQI